MVAAWTAGLIAGLGGVGAWIAVYFTLVTYRIVPPDARWVPAFCRMDEETCAAVIDSEYARVFRVPNSLLGLGWYGAATGAGLAGLAGGTVPLCPTFVLVALVTVVVSVYLAWSLLFRLETHCPLCYTSHLLNGGLLVAFVLGCL